MCIQDDARGAQGARMIQGRKRGADGIARDIYELNMYTMGS
jgi:hypothetical protein